MSCVWGLSQEENVAHTPCKIGMPWARLILTRRFFIVQAFEAEGLLWPPSPFGVLGAMFQKRAIEAGRTCRCESESSHFMVQRRFDAVSSATAPSPESFLRASRPNPHGCVVSSR